MNRILLGFAVLLLISCGTDSSEVGADFFSEGGRLDFSYIDTVSVKLSTIKYEEVPTNASKRLLIGHHDDEKIGSVTAATYFQVSTPNVTTLNRTSTSFNYLALVLKYDRYSYYDTASTHRFKVYRVTEEIRSDADNYIYNHTRFAVSADSLGAANFRAWPHRDDSVVIQLNSALGQELYNKLINGSSDLVDLTTFRRYLRGLAVYPDTTRSGAILGFAPSAELRLYYLDKSVVPTSDKRYVSFPLNASNSLYSNYVQSDTRGTKLNGKLKKTQDVLSASLTDRESYVQGGTGYATRIDFPYLKNLQDLQNFYIRSAILEVYPVHKSYNRYAPLPALKAYDIYPTNLTVNRTSPVVTAPQLFTEPGIPQDSYYYVDVTNFVRQQFALSDENQRALLFQLEETDIQASLNRVYMGTARTHLKIYYATIKEQ